MKSHKWCKRKSVVTIGEREESKNDHVSYGQVRKSFVICLRKLFMFLDTSKQAAGMELLELLLKVASPDGTLYVCWDHVWKVEKVPSVAVCTSEHLKNLHDMIWRGKNTKHNTEAKTDRL